MLKEEILDLVDNIERLNEGTMKECKCGLHECFPACTGKEVIINGKKYILSIEVKLVPRK